MNEANDALTLMVRTLIADGMHPEDVHGLLAEAQLLAEDYNQYGDMAGNIARSDLRM